MLESAKLTAGSTIQILSYAILYSETTIISNIPKKKKEEEYAKILKKDLGGCYLL